MKLASPIISALVASAMLALVGCTKKPDRPQPSQTIVGQNTGGPNIAPPPSSNANFGDLPAGLQPRDTGGFDPSGQNRAALQAQTVLFDFDMFNIKASEREKLKAAKEYLEKNPTHRLLLEGHCDWRGTAEYNLALGDRRSSAVKKYLQTLGVKPERLDTLSKGSLEAAKNADDAARAKDRRVELVVIDPARAMPMPL